MTQTRPHSVVPPRSGTLLVGFDLDMTLVDSSAGIGACVQAALAELGVDIDPAQVWPYIGVPLDRTVRALAPGVDVAVAVDRYRALYPDVGVPGTVLLPGATEAFDAIRGMGGRVLVVSTKVAPAVHAVLDHVGLVADEVVGGLFGADKGEALAQRLADVYVGDHPGDVEAARVGGAWGVAVSTGPHSAADLDAAGADVVLPSLLDLPRLLAARFGL